MSRNTLLRLGAGALIVLGLAGCYYPYGYPGYYHGGYGPPHPHYYWH